MSPFLSGQPWKSTSWVTLRPSPKVIVWTRRLSSTADGISDGSATS